MFILPQPNLLTLAFTTFFLTSYKLRRNYISALTRRMKTMLSIEMAFMQQTGALKIFIDKYRLEVLPIVCA